MGWLGVDHGYTERSWLELCFWAQMVAIAGSCLEIRIVPWEDLSKPHMCVICRNLFSEDSRQVQRGNPHTARLGITEEGNVRIAKTMGSETEKMKCTVTKPTEKMGDGNRPLDILRTSNHELHPSGSVAGPRPK